ncbi:hypothetical protein ASPWEDRAFT_29117 [Aspergillus wentii DTO 134E9]|uniref:Uncharacterized protein n=1 Tax=Aspergillus wentii DTO 134E9 TaxID=1073089 RepID=A0A1L9RGD7_ASPWE|nr:uncharacterized protein ASPWEDRAFT_29117 [Aspergillus wentii DTO 134E9]OJJ33928.1 hypothetical protein ASPWEDRAFT_29117 [Aspergillus wentii DTO 134E9]
MSNITTTLVGAATKLIETINIDIQLVIMMVTFAWSPLGVEWMRQRARLGFIISHPSQIPATLCTCCWCRLWIFIAANPVNPWARPAMIDASVQVNIPLPNGEERATMILQAVIAEASEAYYLPSDSPTSSRSQSPSVSSDRPTNLAHKPVVPPRQRTQVIQLVKY